MQEVRVARALVAIAPVWMAASFLVSVPASAQENKLGADLRRERERLAEKCGEFAFKKVVDCTATILTDHPFHLAFGSLAPNNGFGLGLAFVAPQSKPNDDWRINWSADAVGTPSTAWRAGAYAKFVNTRVGDIGVTGPSGGTSSSDALPRPYPTITVYGQVTSLPKLSYFGLGNETSVANRAAYEMRQSTIGTRVAEAVFSTASTRSPLVSSMAVGCTSPARMTLRAGGVPMVTIWWADGGPEGHHVAITMTTSLLGGSSRPSLR